MKNIIEVPNSFWQDYYADPSPYIGKEISHENAAKLAHFDSKDFSDMSIGNFVILRSVNLDYNILEFKLHKIIMKDPNKITLEHGEEITVPERIGVFKKKLTQDNLVLFR